MLLPAGYASPAAYTEDLSAFVSSELFLLITAQIHHLDVLPRGFGAARNEGDWLKLPEAWQAWFDCAASPEDLQAKLDDVRQDQACSARPASLTCFLQTLRALPLPRSPARTTGGDVQVQPGMSLKKSHEVARFVELVGEIALKRGLRKIIDIGAGQGYLTRTLAALHPSFSFLAIDGSPSQLAGSARLGPEHAQQISYLTAFIRSPASARREIENWLCGEDALVIGLHCCGRLTDDILGMFVEVERIKGVVIAGCCFNHLRLKAADGEGATFPTSVRLRDDDVTLSSTALMAACQDTSNWTTSEGGAKMAARRALVRKKTHFRRLLTVLLAYPDMPATPDPLPLGAVNLTLSETFAEYALRALAKIDVLPHVDAAVVLERARAIEEEMGDWRWEGRGRVVEALAKACGAVVESLIAMDRWWALSATVGVSADLVLGWDYALSPRNIVVVAAKGTDGPA